MTLKVHKIIASILKIYLPQNQCDPFLLCIVSTNDQPATLLVIWHQVNLEDDSPLTRYLVLILFFCAFFSLPSLIVACAHTHSLFQKHEYLGSDAQKYQQHSIQ